MIGIKVTLDHHVMYDDSYDNEFYKELNNFLDKEGFYIKGGSLSIKEPLMEDEIEQIGCGPNEFRYSDNIDIFTIGDLGRALIKYSESEVKKYEERVKLWNKKN